MTAMSIPLTRKGRSPVDRDQRIGCGGDDWGPERGAVQDPFLQPPLLGEASHSVL